MIQIIMLCLPSLLVSAGLIAICLKLVFRFSDDYYSWGFAVTFGAIVSCSDPRERLKALENHGAPKKFCSLLQGVALFNNATAMVLLLIAVQFARGNYGEISNVVKYGITLIVGGMVIGVVFGILSIYWVKLVNHENTLTINVTISSAYLCYFAAEYVDWGIPSNGLVAVLTLGIFMSAFTRQRIRSDSEHSLEVFWHYVLFGVESMVFLITGVIAGVQIIGNKSIYIREEDYTTLPLIYLALLGSRLISVLIFMKLISHWGYGLKFNEMFVFVYSGCKGAVQLSLALLVTQEQAFTKQQSDIILFHTAGIVLLTMLINGSTTGWAIKLTGMGCVQVGREKLLVNFLQEMHDQIQQRLQKLKDELIDKKVDWEKVRYFSGIDEGLQDVEKRQQKIDEEERQEEILKAKQTEKRIDVKFKKHLESINQDQTQIECDEDVDEDMLIEARDRFLRALKQTYWDLFSQNQCSGKAMQLLVESVRWDLDSIDQRMCSWDFILHLFYQPLYMRFLYWIKGFPLIGYQFGNLLFDWVGMGYEVMSTYVRAQMETEEVIKDFPMNHQILQMIIKESQENRNNAERFITGYFMVSFPEIIRLIQNKRAALTVLVTEKKFCEKKHAFGELDPQEYLKMKLQINSLVGVVEDIQPRWSKTPTYKKLMELPVFKEFTEEILKDLCRNCMELIFDKDQCITREGELARYVYILFRGRAIESCQSTYSNYTQVREIGSIISPHHIMLKASLYITQTVAEAMVEVIAIEIETMIKLVNKSLYMQNYLWQNSLYALSRFYFQELKPLGQLESRTIDKLGEYMKFKKYKKGETFRINGAILLTGKVELKSTILPSSLKREYSSPQSGEDTPSKSQFNLDQNQYESPRLFTPTADGIQLYALTPLDILIFDLTQVDKIKEEIQNDLSIERPKKSQFLPEQQLERMAQLNRTSFGFSYLRRTVKSHTIVNAEEFGRGVSFINNQLPVIQEQDKSHHSEEP